jgi:hypothetical protein
MKYCILYMEQNNIKYAEIKVLPLKMQRNFKTCIKYVELYSRIFCFSLIVIHTSNIILIYI